jgi:hypothetical protein
MGNNNLSTFSGASHPVKCKNIKTNSCDLAGRLAYATQSNAAQHTKLDFKEQSSFLNWFSGFTDGEGNFLISLDRGYIRFRFKINMHIDNLEALNTIKSTLKIGSVTVYKDKNYCSFVVQDFSDIKDILCPVFVQFPLLTSKNLDFQDFHKAVLIKNKTGRAVHLSDINKNKIILLKNGMNSNREIFTNFSINSQINVNPDWFIGFLEGEGTFGIKTGSSMYFQVAQKITSVECLNAIKTFLINLSPYGSMKAPYFNNNSCPMLHKGVILPINVLSTINSKTNVMSLVVSSVDSLYFFLLPLLDKSKMYTFKEMDFKLWRIALILKIHGYYYLPEGKTLFLDISDILNKRYSTGPIKNIDSKIEDIFLRYQALLLIKPPFQVEDRIPHVDNVRKFRLENKSDACFATKTIYIYENGILIKDAPFNSFSSAHRALGLKSTSNTCNRYLDTNRLYKSKFKITSKPLE